MYNERIKIRSTPHPPFSYENSPPSPKGEGSYRCYLSHRIAFSLGRRCLAIARRMRGSYYIENKKEAHNLLQDSGYQLPQHLASRLSASGYIIRHIDANVNRRIENFLQSQQFIRWFGDWRTI